MLNLLSTLELAMFNGKHRHTRDVQIGPKTGDAGEFASFEDFREAFRKQVEWIVKMTVDFNNCLGKVHQGVKDERRNDDKRMIETTVNTLISWIWYYNFNGPIPGFKMYVNEVIDKERAERDAILRKDVGVIFKEKYIKKNYNLDDDEFELGEPVAPESKPFSFARKSALEVEPELFTDAQLQKQAEGILKPILDLIKQGNSYEDIMDDLLTTYPAMKADAAQEMLYRAMSVYETVGRFEGKDNI